MRRMTTDAALTWARGHRLLAVILAVELCVMVGFGLFILTSYSSVSPIDEGAHYDYVQSIAEDHRLPEITDRIHREPLALELGKFPDVSNRPKSGLLGASYEAFQPPLYYILAAPVFLIPVDHHLTLYLLRGFGLLLLLLALVPFSLLIRDIAGDRWPLGLAFGGLVFLLPAVLERAVLVSNIALEVPAGALFTWLVYRAHARGSLRWLAAAGGALGVCMLTKFTLVFFVPVFVLAVLEYAWRNRTTLKIGKIAAVAVVPLLMLAPWFAWNFDTYGSLTANSQAQEQQRRLINPENFDYTLGNLGDSTVNLIDFSSPQDWGSDAKDPFPTLLRWFLVSVLFLLPLILATRAWSRENVIATLLLLLPLVTGIVLLVEVTTTRDIPLILPRYLHAALPASGALAFAGWYSTVKSEVILRRVCISALVAIVFLLSVYSTNFP